MKYRKRRRKELGNRDLQFQRREMARYEQETRELHFAERIKPRTDGALACPLCNQPITVEDLKSNVHNVRVDHKDVQLHRTCPGESS